jgi:hypothetical protein
VNPYRTSVILRLVAALMAISSACTRDRDESPDRVPAPPSLGRFQAMACDLPLEEITRIWNGYYPGRSGELQVVPRKPNYSTAGGLTHSGPWNYLQRVPMLWFGPGHVPARGRVERPATMADVAPTIARLIGYRFDAPDGSPLREVLPSDDRRREDPRLVLVVVWDGAGRNVLREHPGAWPVLRRMIPKGVWFEHFTDASSPSVTPAIHTTLGTGAFPRRHGLVDQRFKVDGELVPSHDRGPRYLRTPALADLYDRDNGNSPLIGMVAYTAWHLGMVGHGSYLAGGDRDVAALLDWRTGRWVLRGENAKYFRFPSYVNDVPGLDEAIVLSDLEDGARDEAWLGARIPEDVRVLIQTPAYAAWQTAILEAVIRREAFGGDDVPDLLFTNYKMIDEVGHRWTMNSPQMESVVRASDRALGDLVRILDREVGRGQWVLALTADHGVTPKPSLTGAFAISRFELERDLERTFQADFVIGGRPTQLWLDTEALDQAGYGLAQVAQYVARYTKGQNVEDPAELSPDDRDDRVFAAAFPGSVLERPIPCLRGRVRD